MKRFPALLLTVSAVLVLMLVPVLPAGAKGPLKVEVPPAPLGRVSDYAKVLTADQSAMLEAQLVRYEQAAQKSAAPEAKARAESAAPQIAIVILPALAGDALEEVSLGFAERWKLGSKGDDGVLLLLAVAESQLRLEVGYGAEGRLTDALSSRIVREIIAPKLHDKAYFDGLRSGVAAIHQALSGQPVTGHELTTDIATKPWALRQKIILGSVGGSLLLFLLIGLFTARGRAADWLLIKLFFQFIFSGGRSGGRFSGGGGGFGGGGASGKY